MNSLIRSFSLLALLISMTQCRNSEIDSAANISPTIVTLRGLVIGSVPRGFGGTGTSGTGTTTTSTSESFPKIITTSGGKVFAINTGGIRESNTAIIEFESSTTYKIYRFNLPNCDSSAGVPTGTTGGTFVSCKVVGIAFGGGIYHIIGAKVTVNRPAGTSGGNDSVLTNQFYYASATSLSNSPSFSEITDSNFAGKSNFNESRSFSMDADANGFVVAFINPDSPSRTRVCSYKNIAGSWICVQDPELVGSSSSSVSQTGTVINLNGTLIYDLYLRHNLGIAPGFTTVRNSPGGTGVYATLNSGRTFRFIGSSGGFTDIDPSLWTNSIFLSGGGNTGSNSIETVGLIGTTAFGISRLFSNNTANYTMFSSTDNGASWVQGNSVSFPEPSGFTVSTADRFILIAGGRFYCRIIGTSSNNVSSTRYYSSTDAVNWTEITGI